MIVPSLYFSNTNSNKKETDIPRSTANGSLLLHDLATVITAVSPDHADKMLFYILFCEGDLNICLNNLAAVICGVRRLYRVAPRLGGTFSSPVTRQGRNWRT